MSKPRRRFLRLREALGLRGRIDPVSPPITKASDRLQVIAELLGSGLITQAEYDKKRQQIIDDI